MKLFSTTGLLLIGALVLSAPGVFAQDSSTRCAIASFQSAPASPKKGARRFSAKTVLELRPIVTLAPGRLRPGDTLEVRFFAPTGNLYEARAFTLPTEEETEEMDRHRPSGDREENETGRGEGGNREDGRGGNRDKEDDDLARNDLVAPPLLVGGTAISSSSIFGTWRAEIWTPGARRRACASTFEITR